MARILSTQLFSALFFTSILLNFLGSTIQDEPCPYPCYPPPTGPGSGSGSGTPTVTQPPPETLTPPSQPGSGSGSSYPPPSGYYPTPSANLPNYPSPPYGNNLYGPPPPDPILPYFPYFYKKPPHKTDNQPSSATSSGRSTVLITATNLLVFIFLFTSCSS